MLLHENSRARDKVRAWLVLWAVYAVLFGVTLFMGRFCDAPWDIRLLLWGNPDQYIPVLDEWVIFETDFATYFLAFMFIGWQISYYISRGSDRRKQKTRRVWHVLAVVFGVWHLLGAWYAGEKAIFFWGAHEYWMVFIPLGIAFFLGSWWVGESVVRMDDKDQRKLATVFWLTLLAVLFINVIGEDTIKAIVKRHRPQHDSYAAWNSGIRSINDEVVRASYSYISGHASGFVAQVGLLIWVVRNRYLKAALIAWVVFHAWTRVYTAVHFPYDVFMASVFAFANCTLIYFCLWKYDEGIRFFNPLKTGRIPD